MRRTLESDQLREVFLVHSRRYGSRWLQVEMQKKGYRVGRHGIRKLLMEQGLQAIQPIRLLNYLKIHRETAVSAELCPGFQFMIFDSRGNVEDCHQIV